MMNIRVFDKRLGKTYEPKDVTNIDFERRMVTLKTEKGYKLARFFDEVLMLRGTGIMDCSKEPIEIFEKDCVLISPVSPGDEPFYGVVTYEEGCYLVVNETMQDATLLFQEVRPTTVMGNTYSGGGN